VRAYLAHFGDMRLGELTRFGICVKSAGAACRAMGAKRVLRNSIHSDGNFVTYYTIKG
jgi:hypothetical protein